MVSGVVLPAVEYNVWYRLVDSKDWQTIRVPNPNITEVIVDHLKPGSEYEFMILAQTNQMGQGVFSQPMRYFTKRYCKLRVVKKVLFFFDT